MAKSKATGDPAKAGRYTSAGLRLACPVSSGLLGRSKPAFSRSGRSPARCAQLWTKSRTAWCRWVRSPPATHIPAWWLWWSSTASHKGYQVSDSASGMRRRTQNSQIKAAGSIRVRPAGTAFKNARPPMDASERRVGRPVTVACASCSSHPAWSDFWDKVFWVLAIAVSKVMASAGAS